MAVAKAVGHYTNSRIFSRLGRRFKVEHYFATSKYGLVVEALERQAAFVHPMVTLPANRGARDHLPLT